MKELNPRESGQFISSISKDVFVVESEISIAAEKVCARMKEQKYSFTSWKEWPLHPKAMDESALNWIFVVDTLNFSFWLPSNHPQFRVKYKDAIYEDYEALCACINRALEVTIFFYIHYLLRNYPML